MSNIKINDVPQRIQYLATGGQTQFTVPFPFFQNNFIYVWLDGVQMFMGGAPGQYTVSGAGSPSGGLVTFNTPTILNQIVTIEGIMPIDRTSIYSATISNLTGSDLNGDFNREVVMLQQLNTVQSFLQLTYAPWALVSQDLTVTRDRYIPILLPNQVWAMNDSGTEIIGYDVPASGGVAPKTATYLIQTATSELPNAQVMADLATGLVVNNTSTGVQIVRTLAAVANQLEVTDADGGAGSPTYGFADNAKFPGTQGLGIIEGTTAQRPGTPTDTNFRFNTDLVNLEYWDGSNWVQLAETDAVSIEGTENQVLANGTFGIPLDGAIVLTTPQDIAPISTPEFAGVKTPVIYGANNLPVVDFYNGGATDVNFFRFISQPTGMHPEFLALGSDTDVGVNFNMKGQGYWSLYSNANNPFRIYSGTAYHHQTNFNFANTGGTFDYTFPDISGVVAVLDSNNNLSANVFKPNFATTVTAAGNTVLTVASAQIQEFTGVTTQTVTLPVTSTLGPGFPFTIINNSSGNVTINSSGGNAVLVMAANTVAFLSCVLGTGTTAASWNASYLYDAGAGVLSITGTANQVIASASTGNITLSLPQDIATTSTPTFAGMSLTAATQSYQALSLTSTHANGFPYIKAFRNTSTSLAAMAFGANSTGTSNGDYLTFYNYINGQFGFYDGANSIQTLNLTNSLATFSGQLVAPSFSPNTTAGIIGTTTNNNAASGSYGEFVSSVIVNSSAVTLTHNVAVNITSISLGAGDWDVWGNINWNFTGTGTSNAAYGWISSTSATLPSPELYAGISNNVATEFAPGNNYGISVPGFRFSLSGTTTIYLTATFVRITATATATASGGIYARRRR